MLWPVGGRLCTEGRCTKTAYCTIAAEKSGKQKPTILYNVELNITFKMQTCGHEIKQRWHFSPVYVSALISEIYFTTNCTKILRVDAVFIIIMIVPNYRAHKGRKKRGGG